MRQLWVPKYFAKSLDSLARQVLAPSIYAVRGVKGLRMMDIRLLIDLDNLRLNLGLPVIVNNAMREQSGLRDLGFYKTASKYFASWSMHKYGKAIDFKVIGMPAWEVRKHIIENKEKYPSLTFLEVGPLAGGEDMTWTHISSQTLLDGDDMLFWSPMLGYVTEEQVLADKL